MMKMNKKVKEGIKKKIASFSLVALLLNVAMVGVFAPGDNILKADDNQMCAVAVDVVMIIDRSGSMGWGYPSKLSQAQNAANNFLGKLKAGDQSALVSYATEATPDKPLSNIHADTQEAVDDLNADGGTNIGSAIILSNAMLESAEANPQAVRVAVLLTDGRATCPYPIGACGYVEDDEDIQHAIDAATIASYKIFTIGLGPVTGQNSINEDMLQEIAEITGAKYYHAPSSGDLEAIYTEISEQLCEYGSVSGYKYKTDNEGNNPLAKENWEINLNENDIGFSQSVNTNADGYYTFIGLEPGTYTITETIPDGSSWAQIYGPTPNEFTIAWGDHWTNYNFGNYLPECGNGIVDVGYNNYINEDCDGDCPQECITDDGYAGYKSCVECLWGDCETDQFCGDEIKNGNEDCDDGPNGSETCTSECVSINITCQETISRECVASGKAEITYEYYPVGCNDDYTEMEDDESCDCIETEVAGECVDEIYREWTFTYDHDYCEVREPENREDESCGEQEPYCGDGACNNNETCSSCPQDCGNCGGGGGGGYIPPTAIKITDEKADCLKSGEAVITWKTNITTTNQVVYDDNLVETENLGEAPEYGYASVNEESSSMWEEHSVIITGLTDGITHYFRPVADRNGSDEVVGVEVFCIFEEEGEVKGVETPEPAPVECNYLLEYIKLGDDNNPVEVEKVERFLNEFEGENLVVNGIYEQVDFDAVSRFQEKYLGDVLSPWSHNASTGYVYITTKKKINEIYCQREFPLTSEQEEEVSLFSKRIMEMFAGNETSSETENNNEDNEEDIYGKVGGVEDQADDEETGSEEEIVEDEKDNAENNSEEEAEENKTEEKNGVAIQDIQEEKDNNKSESEYAGDRYSKYFPVFLIITIIAIGVWYFRFRRKDKEGETK